MASSCGGSVRRRNCPIHPYMHKPCQYFSNAVRQRGGVFFFPEKILLNQYVICLLEGFYQCFESPIFTITPDLRMLRRRG
ncbi:hypothetical protein NH44784_060691 [Achromobacter xylosoxidans NH44784-1996]|nr:hypothetical protein NH44784_060691 [Achromobacter xylosoxidans NH44784-1996]